MVRRPFLASCCWHANWMVVPDVWLYTSCAYLSIERYAQLVYSHTSGTTIQFACQQQLAKNGLRTMSPSDLDIYPPRYFDLPALSLTRFRDDLELGWVEMQCLFTGK